MTPRVITTVAEMKAEATRIQAAGGGVGLIATQGHLHAGQASLIAAARADGLQPVVSIFLNPLEYGLNETPEAIPREDEADLAFAAAAGAAVCFLPSREELHAPGHATFVEETAASRRLCGISRPAHFRGFLTNLLKLCQATRPHSVYFGHKDLQQAAVARTAVADLFLDFSVVVRPTVREADGFPVSWRSRFLTPNQRAEAAILPAACERARQLVQQGVRNVDRILAEATHVLSSKRTIRVVYVQCVDPDTTELVREIEPGRTVLAVSVWVDETRFLDNIIL